jgi:predicted phage terminase large subunit-like protein
MTVKLSADLIEAFAGMYLSPRYDDAKPTPPFHRKAWELYASPNKQAGCIAPRDHAKSTGLTFDYILAEVCFRTSDYVILIGSTEDKAAEQLSNISEELETNEDLRRDFGIRAFESQTKTEVIVVHDDGYRFRILARGAEQKIRGAMWKGKRPNLIVCDDMEDDEQVENKDRRAKFRRWFFRAAKQALSKSGKIRIHGTILHEDALLARLQKNKMWNMLFYKAHKSYDDFSELLWPERWTAEDLLARRTEFEEDGDSAGYSQEFLNTPLDNAEAYLRERDFLPMQEHDHEAQKLVAVGVDFAISKKDAANRTSFTVGGKDSRSYVHHIDEHVGRWDSLEIVEKFFEIQRRHDPEVFFVEGGQIWLGLQPILIKEMERTGIMINYEVLQSFSDKAVRGRVFQRKMRAGFCRFDTGAEWFPAYKAELLSFTGVTDAKADDQFDSTAILHRGLENYSEVEEDDFLEEDELDWRRHSQRLRGGNGGVSRQTGY